MAIAHGLLALMQERIAGVLEKDNSDLLPQFAIDDLLGQLKNPAIKTPQDLVLGFGKLLDAADLGGDDDKGIDGLLERVKGRVGGITKTLLEGKGGGAASIASSLKEIFNKTGGNTVDLGGLLHRQASIAVSFVTTLKNIPRAETVVGIRDGWTQYFFGEQGFVTLDGVTIVPPDQLGALKSQLMESGPEVLKSMLSERKADRYVRDLIRVLIEVVGNIRYSDLPARYGALMGKMEGDAAAAAKAVRWFRGAGSHAEAIVTSAVEEISLGIATFQTNPLIAAAAATYAGTVARKATQHVFLSLTETD